MSAPLFSEFESCDKSTWQKQAEKELGDKSWKIKSYKITPDLALDAYYSAQDLDHERVRDLQNSQRKTPGWLNMPLIKFDKPRPTNAKIISALNKGAGAVLLHWNEPDFRIGELENTLHSIKLCDTPVFFQTEINSEKLFEKVSNVAGYYLKGGIANDPLANWLRCGLDFTEPVTNVCNTLNRTKMMREFRPLMVESHVYHNAGATPVQELAYLLSSTVFYLDKLTDAGISPLHAFNCFFYSVSVGPEYLTEIAKLRALRYLHKRIGLAYQLPGELCDSFIHTQTSSFYNALYDPVNNIIRAASEAASAVLGGCNALTVLPYNQLSVETDESSERIARNVSTLLSDEAYMDQVADPAGGSYQLEMLSVHLAEAAWNLFLETEEKGGILSCFEAGYIQQEMDKSWQEKLDALNQGKILVGVNKYGAEKMQGAMSVEKASGNTDPGKPNRLTAKNLSGHW